MGMNAVNGRPVSVVVDASSKLFQSYSYGVLHGNCGGMVDHAVLAVGYGTDGMDYWKIKNSWGPWGEQGYFRVQRGKMTAPSGECGVLTESVYPSIHASRDEDVVV